MERKKWKKIYGPIMDEYKDDDDEKLSRHIVKNSELDSQWKLYTDKITGEKAVYETKLRELSRGDLILEATKKKDNPEIIKLIILSEFKNNFDNIRKKINKLSIKNSKSKSWYICQKRTSKTKFNIFRKKTMQTD